MTVTVLAHPLLLVQLCQLRNRTTNAREFRRLILQITSQLVWKATEQVSLFQDSEPLETPLGTCVSWSLQDRIGIFPILRAGLGMVDAVLDALPTARVHHLGLYREKSTLLPVEYYNKLPTDCQIDLGYILDPMVATAGTAIASINILKDWGLKRIRFLCVLGSREGLQALQEAHPDVDIYVAAVDEQLNDLGYVVPGLGDAGDRLFETHHD